MAYPLRVLELLPTSKHRLEPGEVTPLYGLYRYVRPKTVVVIGKPFRRLEIHHSRFTSLLVTAGIFVVVKCREVNVAFEQT